MTRPVDFTVEARPVEPPAPVELPAWQPGEPGLMFLSPDEIALVQRYRAARRKPGG